MIIETLQEHVIFKVGKESFALNASFVKRIEMNKKHALRKLPSLPPEYRGVITDSEGVVPLFDLRIYFDMHTTDIEEIPYIIVVKIEEMNISVGFVVDQVDAIEVIPADQKLGSLSESIKGNSLDFIKGVYRPNMEKDKDKNADDSTQTNELEVMYSVICLEKLIEHTEIKTVPSPNDKKTDPA